MTIEAQILEVERRITRLENSVGSTRSRENVQGEGLVRLHRSTLEVDISARVSELISRISTLESIVEDNLPVNIETINVKGIVDGNNSTSSTLSANGVFTGKKTEILNYGISFINVYTDVASATDGLSIEQSSDGVNWDHCDCYTVNAGAAKNYSINPHAKYYRVVYTNGAVAQSAFRMQTILKGNSKPSSHRIQDSIADDDDAELVKAVLTGKNNGSFVNVRTTLDGNLTISDNSSGLAIAKGDVSKHSFIHKFGNAPDFDTSDGEVTVWDGAEDGATWENMVYDYSSSADIDSISSSDAGDTVEIEILGLDSDYNAVTQTITLNGQTRVALTTSLVRVFRMINANSTNLVGHVFCYVNGSITGGVPDDASTIRSIIQPENNQTEMAVYTIPNGYTGYMRSWYAATAGASKTSDYIIRLKARPTGGVFQLKHKSSINETGSSHVQHQYIEPEVFQAKTDLEMTVEMTAAGGTGANISAGFDIVLVEN